MGKVYYTAIVERDGQGGFGVFFPDLPGCVSSGDTVQEAALNAEAALALHVAGMLEDGEALPLPTDPTAIEDDPEADEAARLMVGVEPRQERVRVNVMIERNLLAAIDARSDNRSRFLSEAAAERLKEHA